MPNLTSRRFVILGAVAATILAAAAFGYRSWTADSPSGPLAIAGRSEAVRADEGIRSLEKRVGANPRDTDAHLQLANAYLQKAREYGDPSLYAAAENLLVAAERLEPDNPEVYATQSILASARHEFASGLALGEKALAIDSERARHWGVVADAQLELGMYDEAITSLQQMVDRRPDFASYSRISYARELYGDVEGAIEAMEWAIEAGSSSQADLAWAHAQVGNLYLNLNNPTAAEQSYAAALQRVNGYHGALAGQAKLAVARGDLPEAAKLYGQAAAKVPLTEYSIALGEVYAAMGDNEAANRQFELVRAIDKLSQDSGVNTDLELALFEADHGGDSAAAVARARAAYERRPNVHSADVLAWALFRDGRADEAKQYAQESLSLGTRDPLKLFHTALILRATGDTQQAFAHLEEALRLNPHFSVRYRDEAVRTLDELRQLAARTSR